jgi:phospholipid-translocating ATPase
MSPSHQHQPLNTSDHSDDDSESDLDLDLAELGPAPSPGLSRPQNTGSGNHNFGSRIPLRTLRAGRARGRQLDSDGDHEDTLRLLEDGPDAKPDSDGSAASREADTPLLGSLYTRRRTKQTAGTLSRLGSSLRLGSSDRTLRATSPGPESTDEHDDSTNRTIAVGRRQPTRFPMNAVSNSRYTPWTFLPRTLYNEFKFFINIYFLLVALSQFIPQLRIGYIVSYILPLVIVLAVTLGKEAWDDVGRRRRDAEANAEPYTILDFAAPVSGRKSRFRKKKAKRAVQGQNDPVAMNGNGDLATDKTPDHNVAEIVKPSKDIKVGDIVKLSKDQRVPADLVILQTRSQDFKVAAPRVSTHQLLRSDSAQLIETDDNAIPTVPVGTDLADPNKADDSGEAFIRTDQLDGETDWKLRMASPLSQMLELSDLTLLRVVAGKPDRKVNEFVGTIELTSKLSNDNSNATASDEKSAPLTVDNTAWANTVVASSGTVYGVVVYTGSQTRQALSTSASRAKTGLLELEINNLTKILCGLTLSISIILVLLARIEHTAARPWYIAALRFLILFSTVIPISLRVNLDMGKIVYAWYIEHDRNIPGTVVRTSTIPEDLGRVEYLLSDKTGTLTQNGMFIFLSELPG